MLCFRKFPVAKKFMDKGGGGGDTIFHPKLFVSQCRKFRRGTCLCFRKSLVSKNVRDKRGAGITIFRQNYFVSQYRKTS